jgi:hypothetical protein
MCRSKKERPEHGKRCPGPADPRERERRAEARRIRQRMARAERAARRADAAGETEQAEGYRWAVERDLELYEAVKAAAPVRVPRELHTRAADYTPWAAAKLSDDDLVAAMDSVGSDTAAMEQIVATLEYRETQADSGILTDVVADRENRRKIVSDSSPLTNPAARKVRKLSTEQRRREEYRAHIYEQYLDAEHETNGYMLNAAGKAAGIDPHSLFTGPPARAAKYASPELKSFWLNHGRTSYAMWKAMSSGRVDQAATVRAQNYGEAVA